MPLVRSTPPPFSRVLQLLALLLALAAASARAADQCCAACLAQTDPKTRNLTYDPLDFGQCSKAQGICCYGCAFAHGAPNYAAGVTFAADGSARTTVGARVALSFNGVTRLTFDLLAPNQIKSTFVGNLSTQVLPASDGTFALCARGPGTLAVRGWGADACRQVTNEFTIAVAAAADGASAASCDAATVRPADGSGAATPKPNQSVQPQGDSDAKTGANDVDNCSATRGSVRTKQDGAKFCECVGDWRNPPLCDQYSWTKTIVTVLGAVAAVFSIAFSVRAYVKSKKAEREARDKELDMVSENELETMRISPAKRDTSSSPATTSAAASAGANAKRTPSRSPLVATPVRTSGHETTL